LKRTLGVALAVIAVLVGGAALFLGPLGATLAIGAAIVGFALGVALLLPPRAAPPPPKDRALAQIEAIAARLAHASANPEEADRILDQLLEEDAPAFLELRETLVDRMGLDAYAEMVGFFAAMERHAGRAWTALVEERREDVGPALEDARAELEKARLALSQAVYSAHG
jgi:hypothetical protein